jgi:hypothetical protein
MQRGGPGHHVPGPQPTPATADGGLASGCLRREESRRDLIGVDSWVVSIEVQQPGSDLKLQCFYQRLDSWPAVLANPEARLRVIDCAWVCTPHTTHGCCHWNSLLCPPWQLLPITVTEVTVKGSAYWYNSANTFYAKPISDTVANFGYAQRAKKGQASDLANQHGAVPPARATE